MLMSDKVASHYIKEMGLDPRKNSIKNTLQDKTFAEQELTKVMCDMLEYIIDNAGGPFLVFGFAIDHKGLCRTGLWDYSNHRLVITDAVPISDIKKLAPGPMFPLNFFMLIQNDKGYYEVVTKE